MSDEPFIAILQEIFDIAVAQGAAQRGGSGLVPNPFIVRHGAYSIEVHYNGGSSKDLQLIALYDAVARANHAALVARGGRPLVTTRPLSIELRPEHGGDVAAKAKGLNVEWQSGDHVFDRTVYVDTPITDPEVLACVLGPEVRRAAVELLGLEFGTVSIDTGDRGTVCAYLSTFSSREPPQAGRGAAALRAFAQILGNLPAIATSGKTVQRTPLLGITLLLALVGGVGWIGSIYYVKGINGLLEAAFGVSESATSLVWWEYAGAIVSGIIAGVAGAFIYGRIVAAVARGTSSAQKDVHYAQAAAFFGTSNVMFTAAIVGLVLSHSR